MHCRKAAIRNNDSALVDITVQGNYVYYDLAKIQSDHSSLQADPADTFAM